MQIPGLAQPIELCPACAERVERMLREAQEQLEAQNEALGREAGHQLKVQGRLKLCGPCNRRFVAAIPKRAG